MFLNYSVFLFNLPPEFLNALVPIFQRAREKEGEKREIHSVVCGCRREREGD